MKIYWIKFITFLETLLSMLVYNFHKKIVGVQSKNNIKYKTQNATRYNKFNVHYRVEDKIKKAKVPVVVYFHGGGWASYSKDIFTTLGRRIASFGTVVVSCNYGLAPKYKLDDIMADAAAAVKYAREIAEEYGADPDKIYFAGDSAGAHISAMLTVFAGQNKLGLGSIKGCIKGLILYYGVYNLETALESRFPNIKVYIAACLNGKLGTKEFEDNMKKFSPALYDVSCFPPVLLASGAVDKLHQSQSLMFSRELKKAGVKVKEVFFDDKEYKAMHAFMTIDGISTNIEVLEKTQDFIRSTL